MIPLYQHVDKYLRKKKLRNHCWSTYGKQFYLMECFTVTWGFIVIIPIVCFLFWLIDADPVQSFMHHLGSSFNLTVPKFIQLIVILLYLWTVLGCTYIALCSIMRLYMYGCICGFWTSLGSNGGIG